MAHLVGASLLSSEMSEEPAPFSLRIEEGAPAPSCADRPLDNAPLLDRTPLFRLMPSGKGEQVFP